jgi:hypothetical protein
MNRTANAVVTNCPSTRHKLPFIIRSLVETSILVQVFPQTRQFLAPRTASRGFCFCLSRRAFPFRKSQRPQARFRKPSSCRRESCANQVSQSAEVAPLITKLERDFASVEAAYAANRRAKLSSDSTGLAITGLQPWGNGFAIFPSGWYIKSSIPLPPNPDSEFLPLDSYSPVALLPARISPADLNFRRLLKPAKENHASS